MANAFFELWHNGEPTGLLFLSEAHAIHYLHTHDEGGHYEIKPFSPW